MSRKTVLHRIYVILIHRIYYLIPPKTRESSFYLSTKHYFHLYLFAIGTLFFVFLSYNLSINLYMLYMFAQKYFLHKNNYNVKMKCLCFNE